MTDQEIFEKIEKTYATDGGKKFITHLIRSFFPVDKSQFIWEKKEKPMRCCLTGQKLMSKDEVFEGIMQITPEEMMKFLRFSVDENAEKTEHPMQKVAQNRVLGIECEGSDKLLCKQAFEQIYNFYATKLLQGDGHMSWLGKRMMTERGLESVKQKMEVTQHEEKAVYKAVDKRASMSLGDLDVLQNLKLKMEKEGL